ncbi:hypothetical protein LXL04_019442 [Taraxacum kok-saghyz]
MYPVLKSCIRSDAVETIFIMTPHAANPAKTPPFGPPAHAPITKIASFPYVEANDQSVRPHPYALQKASAGAKTPWRLVLYLAKRDNGKEAKEANNKKKCNHPSKRRVLGVLFSVGFSRLFGNKFTHAKQRVRLSDRRNQLDSPEKAMPEVATTQV